MRSAIGSRCAASRGLRKTRPGWRKDALPAARFRSLLPANSYAQELPAMPDVVVLGFPRSTFVHIARLVLTHKQVPYTFRDLEPEMGSAAHLALHPFNRVPILQHGDFTLYETSAIAAYVDEAFDGPVLQPKDMRTRARMNQWISAVNSYYYPYMIYHVSHERRVFPELGIASDEKVVAHALPKIEVGLAVLNASLGTGRIMYWGPISLWPTSTCCRARMA